jgi:anti-sigma regulatory factor (Ser/Thr protein kinase)
VEIALQPRLSQFVVEVSDPSHAGQARRSVVEYAQAIGLGENDSGAVAIAVTELATNVVKHARNGKIIYEQIAQNGCKGLRILSIDKGPGIRNITTAFSISIRYPTKVPVCWLSSGRIRRFRRHQSRCNLA